MKTKKLKRRFAFLEDLLMDWAIRLDSLEERLNALEDVVFGGTHYALSEEAEKEVDS